MSEDPRVQEAIDVVAAEVLRACVDMNLTDMRDAFPGLAGKDWQRIRNKVIETANGGTYLFDYYSAALEFLQSRAEGDA